MSTFLSARILLSVLSCACAVHVDGNTVSIPENWAQWRTHALGSMPSNMVLHAPYTPFSNDSSRSLVTTGIPALAKRAAASGVTVVWVAGSMGQFDSMTVSERKTLNAAWVTACKFVDASSHGDYCLCSLIIVEHHLSTI
eukprot:m.197316 g.197316  ORF g.197316 m.197316 type:complete len:140 (-) comp18713_c0_seq4:1469-1888(-)